MHKPVVKEHKTAKNAAAVLNADASKTMRIDIPPDFPGRSKGGRVPGRHGSFAGVPASQKPLVPDQRRASAELAVYNADLSELFQNVYDSAFITDLDGNVVDANVRATLSFFYSRDEFRSGTIMDVVLGLDETVLSTIRNNLKNDRFTLIQAQCVRKDDSLIPVEISTSCLTLSGKEYLCFFVRDVSARKEAEDAVVAARDDLQQEVMERTKVNEELRIEIAERKRIEDELHLAIGQLQEHDKAKSQFVSNVSHELKTPLSSINYISGNMLKGIAGPMSEQARNYLEMIRADCQRLRRTVDDILDMSRIESNTMRLNRTKVRFDRFVRRTVESLRMQIEAEGLSLDVHADVRGFVDADPQKMERVIFNVVKNAVKYNVAGGSIRVRLQHHPESVRFLILDVIDSGIGIAEEHLPRITERFFRVGEYVSGAGLGLAICKDLLERHGGRIALQSPPLDGGKGTQVSMLLPAAPSPVALLAYEDDEVRLALMRQMDEYGYRVIGGKLGDGSLSEALQGARPDIIILEWISRGMDGGIAVSMIKAHETFSGVPVLAITDAEPALTKREILQGFEIPCLNSTWTQNELWNSIEDLVLGRKRLDV